MILEFFIIFLIMSMAFSFKTFLNIVRKDTSLNMVQPFNPFTSRYRNVNVKWFEADLERFYAFVESQPLLTADQEQLYGRALRMWTLVEQKREFLMNNSLYNNTIVSNDNLASCVGCSAQSLEKMEKVADLSKIKLVNSNLKLVLAIVSRYRTSGIPNSELIAEGTRGLSKAVLRYDYSKGFRFATYATWYVHQAISEYVRWRKHPAKMPSRYMILLRKVKAFSAEYKALHERLPTVSEIVEQTGQSHYDILKVLSMQQYPILLNSPFKPQNSHKQSEGGKDRTFEDLLPSSFKLPLAHSGSKDMRRDMEQMMLVNLNDVERDVLRLRLGMDDGRAKPVKEVGKRFKISWKQVRSVEKEAIQKLRGSKEIHNFVDNFHSEAVSV